jgi:hypothetical protein
MTARFIKIPTTVLTIRYTAGLPLGSSSIRLGSPESELAGMEVER